MHVFSFFLIRSRGLVSSVGTFHHKIEEFLLYPFQTSFGPLNFEVRTTMQFAFGIAVMG